MKVEKLAKNGEKGQNYHPLSPQQFADAARARLSARRPTLAPRGLSRARSPSIAAPLGTRAAAPSTSASATSSNSPRDARRFLPAARSPCVQL